MGQLNFGNRIQFVVLLFIVCINWSCNLESKQSKANTYKTFLTKVHTQGQFNGNVCIVEQGKVVYQGVFGIGNINPLDSLGLNSVFRLASVSKQFTAMGVMLLKEQGKLNYDQDIRDFIPEWPYKDITIRHLLNHVSGLPDEGQLMNTHWRPDLEFNDPKRNISGNWDIISQFIKHQPPVYFKPKEKWAYSNTGYMLLATIISRISERLFPEFLNEEIFKPAGMLNTCVYDYVSGPDKTMPNRVYGFRAGIDGQTLTLNDEHFLNAAQGEGGIYSTLGDLLKWDRILYTEKLISKETLNEAFSPVVLLNGQQSDYGFGWFIKSSLSGKKVVAHSGGWLGFSTYIQREIEDDHCIILLSNNSSPYFRDILQGLEHILHNKPYQLPKQSLGSVIGKIVVNEGIDKALIAYSKIKSEESKTYRINEDELNELGYELMWAGYKKEAVEIFRLNKDKYPKSINVYDSYGDGLLAFGDTTNALINFKITLKMDPNFPMLTEKINGLEGKVTLVE